jgi:hypothetical protein
MENLGGSYVEIVKMNIDNLSSFFKAPVYFYRCFKTILRYFFKDAAALQS